MEEFPQLMQFIFPDSQIAKQVQLQQTKLGYVFNKEKLVAPIKDTSHFVACFDESFSMK